MKTADINQLIGSVTEEVPRNPDEFNLKVSTLFADVNKHFQRQFSNINFVVKSFKLPSFSFKTYGTGRIFYEHYSTLSPKARSKLRYQYLKKLASYFKSSNEVQIKKSADIDSKIVADIDSKIVLYILPRSQKKFSLLSKKISVVFLRVTSFSIITPDKFKLDDFGLTVNFGFKLHQIDTDHALRFFNLNSIFDSWNTAVHLAEELKKTITLTAKAIRLTPIE